jgi:hypothetical protein
VVAVKRRLAETLLLALLLLSVQTAVLAHEHDGSAAPAGAAAQSCEFCVGHHADAPPPEAPRAVRSEFRRIPLPVSAVSRVPATRFGSAHRSRAPPTVRSS